MRELAVLASAKPDGRGLLDQLAKVRTDEDRAFMLERQRAWAAPLERPGIDLSSPARPERPLRIGFLSSDLKFHVAFKDLRTNIEGSENRIKVARDRFNDAVKAYNNARAEFWTHMFASAAGFPERPYFAVDEAAKNAPTIKFNMK